MSDEELLKYKQVEKMQAGLFGIGEKGTTNPVGSVVNQILSVQLSPEEIAGIITVIGIALKAAGLQGLQDIVSMMIAWEQAYVARLKATGQVSPTATTTTQQTAPKS